MKFSYSGYNIKAQKVNGVISAEDPARARASLRDMNIRPIKLKALEGGVSAGGGGAQESPLSFSFLSSPKPKLDNFTAFIRQFAVMQSAGIPIVQTLKTLGSEQENGRFGSVLKDLARRIEGGSSLIDSVRAYPEVFDRVFTNLVAAGEVSGALDKVLERLAIYYEKVSALHRKIKSAMSYPVIVLVLAVVITIGLMVFIVPKFKEIFGQDGRELPASTAIVMDISNFFVNNFMLIMLGNFAVVFLIIFAFKNKEVKRMIDPFLLKIPIFGNLLRKSAIARFCRTLGTMVQSGVAIVDALNISAKVIGNYAIEVAVIETQKSIKEGNSIAMPLQKSKEFPAMAVSMISVGEQTGQIDLMCTKIAEFYEDEVDAALSAITSVIEPLMIVVVGVLVLAVIVPIYLPIFERVGDV